MFRPPEAPPAAEADIDALCRLFEGREVCVLTGAGCSTESGIPDYRSPLQRERVRRPIQHQDFVRSERTRARYWARSLLGWPSFARFEPNACHRALSALAHAGHVRSVITQNVDRLHQKAGSPRVLELHGALERVVCLGCGALLHRDVLQAQLRALNEGFAERFAPELRPDGDAELPPSVEDTFVVPPCSACGGVLKPDVVFFGDNVSPALVEEAFEEVERARALIVAGSSLHVFSGFRFVRRAHERGIPIAVVNLGETRADALAHFRVEGRVSDVLGRVAARLT